MSRLPEEIPQATFHRRITHATEGFKWTTLTTDDLFKDKTVIVFGLPGAFTPTCSGQQLPGFEELYSEFRELGIDDIYCVSVNDTLNNVNSLILGVNVSDTLAPTWNETPANVTLEYLTDSFYTRINASDHSVISQYFINYTSLFTINETNGSLSNTSYMPM